MLKFLLLLKKFFRSPNHYLIRFFYRGFRTQFPFLTKDNYARRISTWGAGNARRVHVSEIDVFRKVKKVVVVNPQQKIQNMSIDLYESLVLNLFAQTLNYGSKIIEIGTFEGNTTINLAKNTKASQVYTVDLPDSKIQFALPVNHNEDNDRKLITFSTKRINKDVSDSIFMIKQDSATINFKKQFGEVDLCFIDGNHSAAYIKSDTLGCYSILKKGGLIIWHDYGYIYSVTKFVDKWAKQNKILVQVIEGTRLAFTSKV